MEDRDDLEKLLLKGLSESEREQVTETIRQQTAKKLRKHPKKRAPDDSSPAATQDPAG